MPKSPLRKIVIGVAVFLNVLLFWRVGRALAFFLPPPIWADRRYWFYFIFVVVQGVSPVFALVAILWRGGEATAAGVSAQSIIRTAVVVIAMILGLFSFADSAYFLSQVLPDNFSAGPYSFDLTTPALEGLAPVFSAAAIFWPARRRDFAANGVNESRSQE